MDEKELRDSVMKGEWDFMLEGTVANRPFNFLIGQAMAKTKGKANILAVRRALVYFLDIRPAFEPYFEGETNDSVL